MKTESLRALVVVFSLFAATACTSTLQGPGVAGNCFRSNQYITDRTVGIRAVGYAFGSGIQGPASEMGNGLSILGVEWVGSGFLVGEDGSVLTNWHVAKHMVEGVAHFDSGASFPIRIIKSYHVDQDLAMLKITANTRFPKVEIADSDTVRMREPVLAVGNAGGRGINMSEGTVSQISRDDLRSPLLITHTAVIQGGNSGGPLFRCGKVIGVNSAGFVDPRSGGRTGFNIAVPINRARGLFASDLWNSNVTLRDAFDPETILDRSQQIEGWTGTVAGAASSDDPGTAAVEFMLTGLHDYLIVVEAPEEVDLNLAVLAANGLIGAGATRGTRFEPLLLSVANSQPVVIAVVNPNRRPSRFGLTVHRISW